MFWRRCGSIIARSTCSSVWQFVIIAPVRNMPWERFLIDLSWCFDSLHALPVQGSTKTPASWAALIALMFSWVGNEFSSKSVPSRSIAMILYFICIG